MPNRWRSNSMIRRSCSCLSGDRCGALVVGDIDRFRCGVFHGARSHVLSEQCRLAGESYEHPLVDAVLGEEPMDLYGSDLSHPVAARDRLVLDAWLPLRFGQHDHRGCLDVETHTTRFDLADENRWIPLGREPVNHDLPLGGGNTPGQRTGRAVSERRVNPIDHVTEVGEDNDFATVVRSFFGDL